MASGDDPKAAACPNPDDPIQFLFELQASIHAHLYKAFLRAEARALHAEFRADEYPGKHDEGA